MRPSNMLVSVCGVEPEFYVRMAYEQQSFQVGPSYPTKQEAKWMAKMVRIALDKWRFEIERKIKEETK